MVSGDGLYQQDQEYGEDLEEDYEGETVLYRNISSDVDRSVAASVILDEMDDVEGPEVFRLDGARASVSQGQEYEDLHSGGFSNLEEGNVSDKEILDAYAARIVLGNGDHHSGNYVASESSIIPIDLEEKDHPLDPLRRAEKYLEDGSGNGPDVELDDREIRPYLVSRAQELAESVDLDKVETRLRTRYDLHRDSMDEEPKDLPHGARYRMKQVEMTRNLEEHI